MSWRVPSMPLVAFILIFSFYKDSNNLKIPYDTTKVKCNSPNHDPPYDLCLNLQYFSIHISPLTLVQSGGVLQKILTWLYIPHTITSIVFKHSSTHSNLHTRGWHQYILNWENWLFASLWIGKNLCTTNGLQNWKLYPVYLDSDIVNL